MADSLAARLPRISIATAIGAALVVGGLLLTGVSWWFLLVVAAGAFGPGAELDDRNEIYGNRTDGKPWAWPRDITPARIYIGEKKRKEDGKVGEQRNNSLKRWMKSVKI